VYKYVSFDLKPADVNDHKHTCHLVSLSNIHSSSLHRLSLLSYKSDAELCTIYQLLISVVNY